LHAAARQMIEYGTQSTAAKMSAQIITFANLAAKAAVKGRWQGP